MAISEADWALACSKYKSDLFRRRYAEGRAESEARGVAKSVLKVLDARGLSVSDEMREQILACTDQVQLDQWLFRAVKAERVDEVFG
ncbi:hypothetical protein ACQEU6_18490 [Spirillospora sp. CA-108201]